MELISILGALLLIAACGLFVAAEFALITVNRSDVNAAVERGDRRARGVLKGMNTLSTQLSGAQLGITLTNLGIGFLAEPAIAALVVGPLTDWGMNPAAARTASVAIALVLATLVTMVFGELVPKNLAIAKPLFTARLVTGFQRGFSTVTRPLLVFFNGTANGILRLMGISPVEELASARSAQELVALASHSARSGMLPAVTAKLLERSVAFGSRRGHDAMTPRSRFISVTPEASIADVLALAAESGHSRFPVMAGSAHSVEGIIHIRRALSVSYEERSQRTARELMSPAMLAPDTIELDDLMDMLREDGLQLAVLIDETGDVAGLLTLEDLVEEIVGEVRDEHDATDPVSKIIDEAAWLIDAALRPDEASELLGVRIPETAEYETVAGLATMLLGRIAKVGDACELDTEAEYSKPASHVRLRVEAMDGARISLLRAEVVHVESTEGER